MSLRVAGRFEWCPAIRIDEVNRQIAIESGDDTLPWQVFAEHNGVWAWIGNTTLHTVADWPDILEITEVPT